MYRGGGELLSPLSFFMKLESLKRREDGRECNGQER